MKKAQRHKGTKAQRKNKRERIFSCEETKKIEEKVIVALDVDGLEKAEKLVNQLSPPTKLFKVGSQLFTLCGLDVIKFIIKKGAKVFLDLKFHDIPHTVACAASAAVDLDVSMFTLHTQGGFEMLKAAVLAAEKRAKEKRRKRPLILGVTVLTSIDAKILTKELAVRKNITNYVLHLAGLAKKAGLDGVVCSPREIALIRKKYKKNFLVVTPGIRGAKAYPKGAAPLGASFRAARLAGDDQKRMTSAKEALERGADYLVIGRPITRAANPLKALKEIVARNP